MSLRCETRGMCIPFLLSMFLNDIEDIFGHRNLDGISVDTFKMFLILYADDIVIFADSETDLQSSLDLLYNYRNRWKLLVNTLKTKILIFRKGGRLRANLQFKYGENNIEIVNRFVYLGTVFTTSGCFADAQNTFAGQGLKAIFKMNEYLYRFTDVSVKHRLELFDKLILPIFNCSEVWGFHPGAAIERVHTQFCKRLLGVKKSTQNDFVYGALGRMSLQNIRFYNIFKYSIKNLNMSDHKYVKKSL